MTPNLGLMSSAPKAKTSTPVLDAIRAELNPAPLTLEQELSAMSEQQRLGLLSTYKMISMMYLKDNERSFEEHVDKLQRRTPAGQKRLYTKMLYEFLGPEAEYQEPEKPVEARTVAVQSFDTRDDFIAKMRPVAQEVGSELGVNADIILAQAALESGFGKSFKGNNLMGIKSHGEEGGIDVVTHEIVGKNRVKITDSFKQYDSPEDSIRGYGKFLKANSRYKHFLRAGPDNLDASLSALQSSGYATDPMYSSKLRTIIKGLQGKADPT